MKNLIHSALVAYILLTAGCATFHPPAFDPQPIIQGISSGDLILGTRIENFPPVKPSVSHKWTDAKGETHHVNFYWGPNDETVYVRFDNGVLTEALIWMTNGVDRASTQLLK